jgi:hypothetical protein
MYARQRFEVAVLGVAVVLLLSGAGPARADAMLNIIPTFGGTITSDPNAAAIEATINSAINYYQATFTTKTASPINVTIQFQEMGSGLGQSTTGFYNVSYQTFINALTAASSGDSTDTTALAHLPTGAINPVTGTSSINVKSANGRALGLDTPGIVNGSFDGVIGLNTSLTTPGSPGSSLQFSLFAVAEHEIDEVLGMGSALPGIPFGAPFPSDLYRYTTAAGVRSFTTSGDNAWLSLDGTNRLVQFNQGGGGDFGDWHTNVTVRVQDAFATSGSSPTLATDAGQVEIINLDAIGYNVVVPKAPPPSVPEPTSLALVALGGGALAGWRRWRKRRTA